VQLSRLVDAARAVAESSGRLKKIERLAALLTTLLPDEIEIAIGYLSGAPRQGRIGIGGSAIREARAVDPAATPTLELYDIDAALQGIATSSGTGSNAAKGELLRQLFRRATSSEQEFLVRLMFGELRQGALEGVLLEAVARASGIPAAQIRRAAMLAGSLAPIARAALTGGEAALDAFIIRPFQPVQPMLAGSVEDVSEALMELGEAALEYKLDGARIQVHKMDEEVRVYSRNLREVTAAVPEIIEAVRRMGVGSAILDGEVLALRPDGAPHPFQITMRRFGRKLEVQEQRTSLPITPFFFDCLYLDGQSLIDEPLSRRIGELARFAPPTALIPRLVTADPARAAAFFERAIGAGHEGVMAKTLGGGYAAGRRGQTWLKIKRAHTLDLVVLGVEWGTGRRRGTLSNLHLGARDAERGGFVMLGKTFKGLTDEVLAWQTNALLALEISRDQHIVYVRPELVVEIAFNDIQESPQYPGGLALRFARVKRYRTDKTAAEADTFATIQRLYFEATGLEAPGR
jgi:DNA ligase-1